MPGNEAGLLTTKKGQRSSSGWWSLVEKGCERRDRERERVDLAERRHLTEDTIG